VFPGAGRVVARVPPGDDGDLATALGAGSATGGHGASVPRVRLACSCGPASRFLRLLTASPPLAVLRRQPLAVSMACSLSRRSVALCGMPSAYARAVSIRAGHVLPMSAKNPPVAYF
jgi:hypothetical protein